MKKVLNQYEDSVVALQQCQKKLDIEKVPGQNIDKVVIKMRV
jgi:hypothetical protein